MVSRAPMSASARRAPSSVAISSADSRWPSTSAVGRCRPIGTSPPRARSASISSRRFPAARASDSASSMSASAGPYAVRASPATARASSSRARSTGSVAVSRPRPKRSAASSTAERPIAASPASSQPCAARSTSPAANACSAIASGRSRGQVGGPPVVGHRPAPASSDGVHALLHQVVGELVVRAAADQQPGPHQLLAVPDRGELGGPGEVGEPVGARAAARSTDAASTASRGPAAAGSPPGASTASASDAGTPVSPAASARRHSTTLSGWPPVRAITAGPCAARPAAARQGVDGRARAGRRAGPARPGRPAGRRSPACSVRTAATSSTRAPAEPLGQVAQQVDAGGAAVVQVVDREQHGAVAARAGAATATTAS